MVFVKRFAFVIYIRNLISAHDSIVYQIADCNVNIHRNCLVNIQDNCLGSEPESQKKKDRLRQFKDKIRPKSDAQKRRSGGNLVVKRPPEDGVSIHSPGSLDMDLGKSKFILSPSSQLINPC